GCFVSFHTATPDRPRRRPHTDGVGQRPASRQYSSTSSAGRMSSTLLGKRPVAGIHVHARGPHTLSSTARTATCDRGACRVLSGILLEPTLICLAPKQ